MARVRSDRARTARRLLALTLCDRRRTEVRTTAPPHFVSAAPRQHRPCPTGTGCTVPCRQCPRRVTHDVHPSCSDIWWATICCTVQRQRVASLTSIARSAALAAAQLAAPRSQTVSRTVLTSWSDRATAAALRCHVPTAARAGHCLQQRPLSLSDAVSLRGPIRAQPHAHFASLTPFPQPLAGRLRCALLPSTPPAATASLPRARGRTCLRSPRLAPTD